MEKEYDYYKILGVGRNATKAEIKNAYKKRSLECHPDKFACAGEKIKSQKTKEFQLLNEAYSCLHNEKSRRIYDATHPWPSERQTPNSHTDYSQRTYGNAFRFQIGDYFSPWIAASVCLIFVVRGFTRSALYISLFNIWGYKVVIISYSVVILFFLYSLYRHYRNI